MSSCTQPTTAAAGSTCWTTRAPSPAGGDETWNWPTPPASFPEGSYLVRIEGYRASESLHYVQHMEKIYVKR